MRGIFSATVISTPSPSATLNIIASLLNSASASPSPTADNFGGGNIFGAAIGGSVALVLALGGFFFVRYLQNRQQPTDIKGTEKEPLLKSATVELKSPVSR